MGVTVARRRGLLASDVPSQRDFVAGHQIRLSKKPGNRRLSAVSLSAGQIIANYRIVGALGAGAMGEVYRAEDTRLGREVAIKVLPSLWRGDSERMRRFEREARLLAGLSHPNIAHVYGLEELDGTHFLVMELVEGETLASRLRRGALPVEEAAAIALQVAEGLEAAHEAGVIHRDLKPSNILLGRSSAKILDFGLAKPLVRYDHDASTLPLVDEESPTREGQLLGTPAYMSPEQIRAQELDRRTDIWAFGCVLFECLTATPAFGGGGFADTLASIVERKPDLDLLPPTTPPHLRTLVARCLDKNPRTRLQDIGEARIALGQLADDVPASPVNTGAKRGALRWPLMLALAALAAVLAFAKWPSSDGATPANPLDREGILFTKITEFEGAELDAAISRDGRYVAFVSNRDGPFDAWVGPIGAGRFWNLTQGQISVWWLRVRDIGFSLEGTEVWLSGGNEHRRMQLVNREGGPLSLAPVHEKVVNVDWNSDGTRMVYHRSDPGDPLYVARHDWSDPDPILSGGAGVHQHYPVWSTDDRWIYFVRGRPATGDQALWRVRPDGASPEQLTWDKRFVAYPAPIDAGTVLYVAEDKDGSGPWLWYFDVASGISRRASLGVERYHSISASKDGRHLVATVGNPDAHLWRIPIPDSESGVASESDAALVEDLRSEWAYAPRFVDRDGKETLYYLSSRGGADGLWRYVLGADASQEIRKGVRNPPAVSPDGTRLAVVRQEEGGDRWHLYLLSADGAPLGHDLSKEVDVRGTASWSPDGDTLVVGGLVGGNDGLFLVPTDGGEPVVLVEDEVALNPVWSPRDDLIFYMGPQEGATHQLRAVRSTGEEVAIKTPIELSRNGERIRFLPDGSGLVYMQGNLPTKNFHLLRIESGEILDSRPLTNLESSANSRSFDIAPDGKSIVFDRIRDNSDVIYIALPD